MDWNILGRHVGGNASKRISTGRRGAREPGWMHVTVHIITTWARPEQRRTDGGDTEEEKRRRNAREDGGDSERRAVRIHTNKAVLSHMTNSQQLYDLQINLNSTNSSSTGLINSPDLLHPANRRAALASQHRHPPPSESCCQILMFQLDVRQSVSILWPGSETQQSTIFLQNH